MDKVKEGVKSTGIPDNLQPGSFGISPEGAQQALTNRLNAPSRASRLTGIPDDLEAGSFGISEAGAEQALTNRVNRGIESTGIPANLPEGAFTVTPKKKFNIPNKKSKAVVYQSQSGSIVTVSRGLRNDALSKEQLKTKFLDYNSRKTLNKNEQLDFKVVGAILHDKYNVNTKTVYDSSGVMKNIIENRDGKKDEMNLIQKEEPKREGYNPNAPYGNPF